MKPAISSELQSFTNSCKLFFGNAYLSIPNTFNEVGWLSGMLMFTILAAINWYTMYLQVLCSERHRKIPSYSELARRIMGRKTKLIVDICIWIMQVSNLIEYTYFMGQTIELLVCENTDHRFCIG